MKKTLLTTLFLLYIVGVAFCQKFSANDLNRMVNMADDDFDTYVTSKGFHFNENRRGEHFTGISYHYDGKAFRSEYTLCKWFYTSGDIAVTYNTVDKDIYLAIKSQAKSLGYKLVDTKNESDAIWFTYRKGKMELCLISSIKHTTAGVAVGGGYEITAVKRH